MEKELKKRKDPWNVLYLTSYGDKLGGGERSFLGLLKMLDRRMFNPKVVLFSHGRLKDEITAMGINAEVITLSQNAIGLSTERKNIGFFPLVLSLKSVGAVMAKLCGYIRANDISLIHTQCFKSALIGGLVSKVSGVPLVRHERTLQRHGCLDGIATVLSGSVIAISHAVKEKFGARSNVRVRVIHNGIDLNEFKDPRPSTFRKEIGVGDAIRLVGMVSQLIPWKGQRYFIEASKLVIEKRKDLRFIIGGGVPPFVDARYRDELIALSKRLNVHDYFVFTGYREDIQNIVSALDVVVCPSLCEPFGRVIIEAMALGKPVVATRRGGIPEIVVENQTGILVEPADSKTLAHAIMELLEDGTLARTMGLNGRVRVEAHFSIEKNARETERLYMELLNGISGGISGGNSGN